MTEQSQRALDRNDDHVAEATERVAPMVVGVPVRLASLIARAEALAASGKRRILGITGAPGCGKGTVAEAVLSALGSSAVVVPMDGFHLAGADLDRLHIRSQGGAGDLRRRRVRGAAAQVARTQRGDGVRARIPP
jgi:pantothenate kinase